MPLPEGFDLVFPDPEIRGEGTVTHPQGALERVRAEYHEALSHGATERAAEIRGVLEALQRGEREAAWR